MAANKINCRNIRISLIVPAVRRWSFVEKTAIVSAGDLDAQTTYPQPGMVDCEIVQRSRDAAGREVIRINTGIETTEGVTQFDVLPESLVE